MKSREIIIGTVCLAIGLGVGFYAANSLNREQALATAANPAAPDANSAAVTVPASGMQADVTATLTAADSEPQNFAAQMKAGDMYAQIGRFEKAVEYYKRGVVINPANFQANVVLANALFDSQQFEDAEAYYSKALQINPNDANARTDLGTTFVERPKPDYDRAIEEFQRARKADPNHLPSLYYLGIATLRKGDRDGARKILTDLEKAGPTSDLVGRLRQNIDAPTPTIQ
ncbi:MAG TPA: tetratricopeptide repeat protein [Pyrinomonadaceae bacterium]|nr:tetratricopeptide repeat protein [Pyrinomonadaceae bacterium]